MSVHNAQGESRNKRKEQEPQAVPAFTSARVPAKDKEVAASSRVRTTLGRSPPQVSMHLLLDIPDTGASNVVAGIFCVMQVR